MRCGQPKTPMDACFGFDNIRNRLIESNHRKKSFQGALDKNFLNTGVAGARCQVYE